MNKKRKLELLIIFSVVALVDSAYIYMLQKMSIHVVILFIIGVFVLLLNLSVLLAFFPLITFRIKEKKRKRKVLNDKGGNK